MKDVRIEETYDGVCTVTVGTTLVISGLTRQAAEEIKAYYATTDADGLPTAPSTKH